MPRVPDELAVLLTLLWLAWLFSRTTPLLGVGALWCIRLVGAVVMIVFILTCPVMQLGRQTLLIRLAVRLTRPLQESQLVVVAAMSPCRGSPFLSALEIGMAGLVVLAMCTVRHMQEWLDRGLWT